MSAPHRPPESVLQALRAANAAAARNRCRLACPTYTHADQLAEHATADAVALAGLVRDEDPRVLFGALTYYTHEQLAVLAVALAAMVPPDRSAADLLAWLGTPATEVA